MELGFLKSAFTEEDTYHSTQEVIEWVERQNATTKVNITKIQLKDLQDWRYNNDSGSLVHDTGKFFSIDGIRVKTNWGEINEWEQPIINQPEVGYLGFIAKEINGVLHFLLQAKIEPGNVNHIQLSPTLQATRSNYTQVHKGSKPRYLELFQKAGKNQILVDQLQSEQGARFLKKRNRNIIIKINDEIPIYDNYKWLTLAQIKKLMRIDNIVNMDTRTVISGIPFGSFDDKIIDFINFFQLADERSSIRKEFLKTAISSNGELHTTEEIITFMTHFKSMYDLDVNKIPLHTLDNWIFDDENIRHRKCKYFKVIGVDVEIENREVVKWCQPMVQPSQEGLCAFVCKIINGVLHFAVQSKLECGNFDIIEMAPTVQCLTGNYKKSSKGELPFLDFVLNANKEQVIIDSVQSEEGGRFYKEQNRNMIVLAGEEIPDELPPMYIWMTLNQLFTFLKFNNFLNIQARSLISAIYFI